MSEHSNQKRPVLIVDDDVDALNSLKEMLNAGGVANTIACHDSRRVMKIMAGKNIGLVLLDLSLPHVSGEELLSQLVVSYPQSPVVVVSGTNEIETVIRCMRAGAFDFLVKPIEETRFFSTVRRAMELCELRFEYGSFKDRVLTNTLEHPEAFARIVTANAAMHSLFQYAETIALTPRPILITGETGVGKELFAHAIHAISKPARPFVAVNVAGLDDNMFSDTLFGHVQGAFTGANKPRRGLVERAAGGTLFLDEIGDMEAASQIKLLRLLQEQEYFPLGSDAARPCSSRIIVATNRNLNLLQKSGGFRSDLYYRLQTHSINIPPLRDRLDDVPVLANHFIEHAAQVLKKKKPTVPRELYTLLANYSFPGNVRELEGMIFDVVSRHRSGIVSCDLFKAHIDKSLATDGSSTGQRDAVHGRANASPFTAFIQLPTLSEAPFILIDEAMKRADGNQSVAARLLGISRSGLSKALKRRSSREKRS